ncbi:MAG: protein kinase domain-containing protein [Myxococcota bacterium]
MKLDHTLGRYVIKQSLGKGAMGEVYKAVLHGPAGFRKHVAVKSLSVHIGRNSEKHREDLIREAQLGGLLQHVNIVTVFELIEINSAHYMVMELMDGPSVKDIMGRAPVPLTVAIDIIKGCLRGLRYAHGFKSPSCPSGVVHRDIKPSNILISSSAIPKIADFGLAKKQGQDTAEKTGIYGTPFYMSPEGARGELVDGRSDLFSLGLIFFELITGRRVLEGVTGLAVLLRVQSIDSKFEQIEVVQQWRQQNPELYLFLKRCLSPDLNTRYSSAAEALNAIRSIKASGPSLEDWLFPVEEVKSMTAMMPKGIDDTQSDIYTIPPVPAQSTSFVGRHEALHTLEGFLSDPGSLLSIKGTAGIGKTALMSHFVMKFADRFESIWWVPARELNSLDELAEFLLQLTGAVHAFNVPKLSDVIPELFSTQENVLLVLDAPETILPLLREVLDDWRHRNPTLSIVLCSRERLNLEEEQIIELGPLKDASAYQLLIQSVESKKFGDPDIPVLKNIVRLLEGHPLAILLTAHQLQEQSPATALQHLQRNTLSQATAIRDTLALSWQGLTETEVLVLGQLSVCVDGFSIAMVESIIDLSATPSSPWVLDILDGLIQKSLLSVDRTGPELRFRMLQIIRKYASRQVDAQVLLESRRRLTKYLSVLHIIRTAHIDWSLHYHRLQAERRNILQCIQHAQHYGWLTFWGDLVLGLCELYLMSGPHPSIPKMVSRVIEKEGIDFRLKARLAGKMSIYSRLTSQYETALDWYNRGLSYLKVKDNAKIECELELNVLRCYTDMGRYEDAYEAYERSMQIAEFARSRHLVALTLIDYGYLLCQQSEMAAATAALERAARILVTIEDWPNLQRAMSTLGLVAIRSNNAITGERFYRRALNLSHQMKLLAREDLLWMNLAICAAYQNQLPKAERYFLRALEQAKKKSARRIMAIVYANIALLLLVQNKRQSCARFLGYAEQLLVQYPHPITEHMCSMVGTLLALVEGNINRAYEKGLRCMQVVREKAFHFKQAETLSLLIEATAKQKKWTDASMLLEELAHLPNKQSAIHQFSFWNAKGQMAALRQDQDEYEEAIDSIVRLFKEEQSLTQRIDIVFMADRLKLAWTAQ